MCLGLDFTTDWDGQFAQQTQHRSIVGLRSPQDHVRLRRLWSRAFTPEALRHYHTMLERRVTELLEALRQRKGMPLDIAVWFERFSQVSNSFRIPRSRSLTFITSFDYMNDIV